jgi:hypothetical protein
MRKLYQLMDLLTASSAANLPYLVRFQVLTAASIKFRVFWVVALCSHFEVDRCFRGALMMEAVCTSETSVNFNVTTRRYIPEDCKPLTNLTNLATVAVVIRTYISEENV